jgi:hypothetical protein
LIDRRRKLSDPLASRSETGQLKPAGKFERKSIDGSHVECQLQTHKSHPLDNHRDQMNQDVQTVIPTTDGLQYKHLEKVVPVMKPRKTVQFVELPRVQIIENAKAVYTSQELSDLFYTKHDVRRWRRLCNALAEDLSFYSDDELWDRFAVRSKAQQQTRRRIRWALRCAVEGLNENHALLHGQQEFNCENVDGDDDSSRSNESLDSTLEEYFRISHSCLQVAVERALRTEQEVMMVQ